METLLNKPSIDSNIFYKIIDNIHDEIMVFDKNYTLIYLNKASYRHYGVSPISLIGKSFSELTSSHYWNSSTLPIVYRTKNIVALKQKTILGSDIVTISVPVLDNNGEVEYVAMCVNDINTINELYKDSEYNIICNEENLKDISTEIIYQSKEMEEVIDFSKSISTTKSPCLILGETGTGKSLLAKFIHQHSNRNDKPFIKINCACVNDNLIESELFGYTEGSFSGANKGGKKGLMEMANGGILFLDEISEIPYSLQSKFLQVIQDGEFFPIGALKSIKIDIKIIAATNCNLENMIEIGTFRKDLYYRLNVFEILIPPLRGRTSDIIKLTYYYLNLYNNLYKRNHSISKEVINILTNYSWPGNVRELSHLIENLIVLIKDNEIKPPDLPKKIHELKTNISFIDMESMPLDNILNATERQIITEAYNKFHTSIKVAKELRISQSRAYRLINKYILKDIKNNLNT
ncbi:sigma-54 interaction domain-containing protein [Clostridium sp.]